MNDDMMNDDTTVWQSLIKWVQQPSTRDNDCSLLPLDFSPPADKLVGIVHANLQLRRYRYRYRRHGDDGDGGTEFNNDNDRGIYCCIHPISRGEILIRLPMRLAVDGKAMPETYPVAADSETHCSPTGIGTSTSTDTDAETPRPSTLYTYRQQPVSTWLRCLAAFLRILQVQTNIGSPVHDKAADALALHDPNYGPTSHPSNDSFHAPFIASLPIQYETLWAWTGDQLHEFLAGADPPNVFHETDNAVSSLSTANTTTGIVPSWSMDSDALRQGYKERVRPYLLHCGIVADVDASKSGSSTNIDAAEFQAFAHACQVLSTRGFYMNDSNTGSTGSNIPVDQPAAAGSYSGPYLLPVMDLLNHAFDTNTRSPVCVASTTSTSEGSGGEIGTGASPCCTRVKLVDGCFVMVAERTIAVGDEILHSYGNDHMHSRQCLASYGFIPHCLVQRAAASMNCDGRYKSNHSKEPTIPSMSPVVLTKLMLWESAWHLIESKVPEQVATTMHERSVPDEPWSINVDRSRTANWIPTHLVLSSEAPTAIRTTPSNGATRTSHHFDNGTYPKASLLTDQLVTAACVPFLPRCAYSEMCTPPSLLDQSILQDYFLGTLVGMTFLETIRRRMALYRPISLTTRQRLGLVDSNDDNRGGTSSIAPDAELLDDIQLLKRLIVLLDDSSQTLHASAAPIDPTLHRDRVRLTYGLTIRIEEKWILNSLSEEVVAYMANLNDCSDGIDEDSNGETGKSIKQQRVA